MPNLTIHKTVTYTDPDSETSHGITGTKILSCASAQRLRFTLSSSSNTQILTNGQPGLTTGTPQYVAIKNVGAASAYIHITDLAGNPFEHEIPTGAIFDFFGEDIWGSGGTQSTLTTIHAKGNTELEVDVFM